MNYDPIVVTILKRVLVFRTANNCQFMCELTMFCQVYFCTTFNFFSASMFSYGVFCFLACFITNVKAMSNMSICSERQELSVRRQFVYQGCIYFSTAEKSDRFGEYCFRRPATSPKMVSIKKLFNGIIKLSLNV